MPRERDFLCTNTDTIEKHFCEIMRKNNEKEGNQQCYKHFFLQNGCENSVGNEILRCCLSLFILISKIKFTGTFGLFQILEIPNNPSHFHLQTFLNENLILLQSGL